MRADGKQLFVAAQECLQYHGVHQYAMYTCIHFGKKLTRRHYKQKQKQKNRGKRISPKKYCTQGLALKNAKYATYLEDKKQSNAK